MPMESSKYLRAASLIVIAGAFLLRLQGSMGFALNADEGIHLLVGDEGLRAVFRDTPHPPLYFLFLHFWHLMFSSETALRLPSVIAGTAGAWFAARWVALMAGEAAAFGTLLLLAASPFAVSISVEVRAYALLLFFLAGALYWLERALQEGSRRALVWHGVFLVLAELTHYTAIWCAIAMGIYGLLHLRRMRPPWRISWLAVQVFAASWYLPLYVLQIRYLRGGSFERDMSNGPLREGYANAGRGFSEFVGRQTLEIFEAFCGNQWAGVGGAALALCGIVWLILVARRKGAGKAASACAVLLLLPFGVGAIGGWLGLLPYIGTRHCAYILPFVAAPIGMGIAAMARQRWVLIGIAGVIAIPVWQMNGRVLPDSNLESRMSQDDMSAAIAYLRSQAETGAYVVMDMQSKFIFLQYGGPTLTPNVRQCGLDEQRIGQHRTIHLAGWTLPPARYLERLSAWRENCAPPGPLWVFDAGWNETALDQFTKARPDAVLDGKRFGQRISVFRIR